jgi:hypothetical protein
LDAKSTPQGVVIASEFTFGTRRRDHLGRAFRRNYGIRAGQIRSRSGTSVPWPAGASRGPAVAAIERQRGSRGRQEAAGRVALRATALYAPAAVASGLPSRTRREGARLGHPVTITRGRDSGDMARDSPARVCGSSARGHEQCRGHAAHGYRRVMQRPRLRRGRRLRGTGDAPPCRFDAAGNVSALKSSSIAARVAGVAVRCVTASDAHRPARTHPGPCVRRFARRVFSLDGQGGDLPVLRVPCRDGDGQTPASPWQKPAPSIAASPQRNLTPWPLSLRDDAVQQESSPGPAGHSSRGKIPKPLSYAAGC